jgi:hypothetical protein
MAKSDAATNKVKNCRQQMQSEFHSIRVLFIKEFEFLLKVFY